MIHFYKRYIVCKFCFLHWWCCIHFWSLLTLIFLTMFKASVYVENLKDPVMKISLMELTRIKNSYLSQIVLSVNLCDGCSDDAVSIIFTDEESFTVTSVLKSLSMIKAGYSIITDSGKDLSRRLGLLSSASKDLNNCQESFSTENSSCPQMKENINNCDNNQEIQLIETIVEGESVVQLC